MADLAFYRSCSYFASGPAEYLNKESFAKSRLMSPEIKGIKGIRNVRVIYKYHKGIKVLWDKGSNRNGVISIKVVRGYKRWRDHRRNNKISDKRAWLPFDRDGPVRSA